MKNQMNAALSKKSCALSAAVLAVWLAASVVLWRFSVPLIASSYVVRGAGGVAAVFVRILLVFNTLFLTFFWFAGIKNVVSAIWYAAAKRRLSRRYLPVVSADPSGCGARVAFLCYVRNNFNASCLEKCMKQTYRHAEFFILDDSDDEEHKSAADEFAASRKRVTVVRRGGDGGMDESVNFFMQSEEAVYYDYIVLLSPDEIIPTDFVQSCLKYFVSCRSAGIVQAAHIATRNSNLFMKLLHIGVNARNDADMLLKQRYGASTLRGGGAMISTKCYNAVGGLPENGAAETGFFIAAANAGYESIYAPDIVCECKFPRNYALFRAHKSREVYKSTVAAKQYSGAALRARMRWYEKADLLYSLIFRQALAFAALLVALNIIIVALLGADAGAACPLWLVVPTLFLLASPVLYDLVYWLGKINIFRLFLYVGAYFALAFSILFTTVRSTLFALFGKKLRLRIENGTTFLSALRLLVGELIFAIPFAAAAALSGGNVWLSISGTISVTLLALSALILPALSAKEYGEGQTELVDKKSAEISLKNNRLAWLHS